MRTVALLILGFWLTVTSAAAGDHGHFEGTVQAECLHNGRDMKLLAPFA